MRLGSRFQQTFRPTLVLQSQDWPRHHEESIKAVDEGLLRLYEYSYKQDFGKMDTYFRKISTNDCLSLSGLLGLSQVVFLLSKWK